MPMNTTERITISKKVKAVPALPDGRSWWMQYQTGYGMTKVAEQLFVRSDVRDEEA
jgi:hypothetical protein